MLQLNDVRDVAIDRAACPEGADVFLQATGPWTRNVRLRNTNVAAARATHRSMEDRVPGSPPTAGHGR